MIRSWLITAADWLLWHALKAVVMPCVYVAHWLTANEPLRPPPHSPS